MKCIKNEKSARSLCLSVLLINHRLCAFLKKNERQREDEIRTCVTSECRWAFSLIVLNDYSYISSSVSSNELLCDSRMRETDCQNGLVHKRCRTSIGQPTFFAYFSSALKFNEERLSSFFFHTEMNVNQIDFFFIKC